MILPAPKTTLDLKPLTPAQLVKARQTLSAGRYLALQKAPYFQRIVHKLVVRETPPSPKFYTVGVTERLIMLTCMEYVHTLTPEMMAGDFIHESLHIFQNHGPRRGTRDPRQWNEAGDLAIDTIARDMGFQQTPVALWPKDFGFPEHLAADEYYALLDKKQKGGGGKGSDPKGAQPGSGHCGSCAGHAVEGEPEAGADDPDARSQADVDIAVHEVAEAIKAYAASKGRGSVPRGLLLMADDAIAPPKVPWQRQLDRAVRGACAWTSGAVDHHYNQPGKRQASLGYGAGRPIMPAVRRPCPRVAFALDTSGSMGCGPDSPLAQGVNEAHGVIKAVGAEVDFVAVDSSVHAVKKVRTASELLSCVKGGGGTSFVPGFRAVEKMHPRPHVMIYATDGDGDAPAAPPRGIRVIWLLIGKNAPVPARWGEVIRIGDD